MGATSVVIAALVALPAVYLIVRTTEIDGETLRGSVFRPRTGELIFATTQLAVAVTLLSVVLGVTLAWCVSRTVGRGRGVILALLSAPLAIPSYVSGFAWTRTFIGFDGLPAAVVVLTLACYPLVMLPAVAALSSTGRSAEDAARSLGVGPFATFLRVTIPSIWPATAGGALLVALYTISDFGGPAIVRFTTFTVGIYNAYNGSFDRSLAAVYGCGLALMAIVLALAERRVRPEVDSASTADRQRRVRTSPASLLFIGAVIAVGLVFPIVALCREVARSRRVSLTGEGALADLWEWVSPLAATTLGLSLLAGAVIVACSLPVAFFVSRTRTWLTAGVEGVISLGYALPGITVALSLVFFGVRVVPDLYLTTTMLVFAYVILFLPVCLGPLRSGLDAIPSGQLDAARSLGSGFVGSAARVSLPAAGPALLAGAALACLSVAKELPATLMLAPIGTRTLATDMWGLHNDLRYGQAAVLGLALILVSSVPTIALSTYVVRRKAVS